MTREQRAATWSTTSQPRNLGTTKPASKNDQFDTVHSTLASPLHEVRGGLDAVSHLRRSDGHIDRLRAGCARLAALVRHADAADDRRNLLRTRPSDDRRQRRTSDGDPGDQPAAARAEAFRADPRL